MKLNPPDQRDSTRTVTRDMVYHRTRQLAQEDGRRAHQIRQVDFERARRELTGESDITRQDEILDRLEALAPGGNESHRNDSH